MIIISALFISSCKKNQTILFCAGIATDAGTADKCGSQFYSGELTIVITKDSPFGSKIITVEIYELDNTRKNKIETLSVKVNPDKSKTHTTIALLNKGTYQVSALVNKKVFAEGTVIIFD